MAERDAPWPNLTPPTLGPLTDGRPPGTCRTPTAFPSLRASHLPRRKPTSCQKQRLQNSGKRAGNFPDGKERHPQKPSPARCLHHPRKCSGPPQLWTFSLNVGMKVQGRKCHAVMSRGTSFAIPKSCGLQNAQGAVGAPPTSRGIESQPGAGRPFPRSSFADEVSVFHPHLSDLNGLDRLANPTGGVDRQRGMKRKGNRYPRGQRMHRVSASGVLLQITCLFWLGASVDFTGCESSSKNS